MTKKISVIFSFVLILSMVVLSGCGCANNSATNYEVRLEVWGLFDDSDVMAKAIAEYEKRNPRVKEIVYKKLTVDSYENDLMDALATGNGPDIFLIHNTWLPKHADKLAPAPVDNLSSNQTPVVTPLASDRSICGCCFFRFCFGRKSLCASPFRGFARSLLQQRSC